MADDFSVKVVIDKDALVKAGCLSDGIGELIRSKTEEIAARAMTLSSGNWTGIWHDHETGEERGPSAPDYVGDVERGDWTYIGIVHPANYAAMKDNHEHNTLLKAKG